MRRVMLNARFVLLHRFAAVSDAQIEISRGEVGAREFVELAFQFVEHALHAVAIFECVIVRGKQQFVAVVLRVVGTRLFQLAFRFGHSVCCDQQAIEFRVRNGRMLVARDHGAVQLFGFGELFAK